MIYNKEKCYNVKNKIVKKIINKIDILRIQFIINISFIVLLWIYII